MLDQKWNLLNEYNEKILALRKVEDIKKEIEDAHDLTLRIMDAKAEIAVLTMPSTIDEMPPMTIKTPPSPPNLATMATIKPSPSPLNAATMSPIETSPCSLNVATTPSYHPECSEPTLVFCVRPLSTTFRLIFCL